MTERIAIVGAGAIGATFGAYLIRGGYDVTLIDTWPAHVEAMKSKGLTLTDLKGVFTVKANALNIGEVSGIRDQFDFIFLAVKSYDTRWMTHMIAPYLKPSGAIVSAQNGLNDETIAEIVGYTRTIGCVPVISAGIYEPGHVYRTSPVEIHSLTVGELSGMATQRVKRLAEILNATVGDTDVTTNIWGLRWSKLVINCMMNAISGIIGQGTQPHLPADQLETLHFIRAVTGVEAVKVATALGLVLGPMYTVPPEDFAAVSTQSELLALKDKLKAALNKRYVDVADKLGVADRPSLSQDVMKGRKTEVDFLNGVIVTKGRELGIPTPMNEAILNLTKEIENRKAKPDAANLELLKPYIKVS